MTSNNAFERTVDYRGSHPGCLAVHAASGIVAGRSTRSLDGMRQVGSAVLVFGVIAFSGGVASAEIGQYLLVDQLIAESKHFNGKPVAVQAYVTIEFEGDRLCARPSTKIEQCVWLQFDDGPYKTDLDLARFRTAEKRWREFDGKRVLVRGTFNARNKGHMGLFRGAIEHVTKVEIAQ